MKSHESSYGKLKQRLFMSIIYLYIMSVSKLYKNRDVFRPAIYFYKQEKRKSIK